MGAAKSKRPYASRTTQDLEHLLSSSAGRIDHDRLMQELIGRYETHYLHKVGLPAQGRCVTHKAELRVQSRNGNDEIRAGLIRLVVGVFWLTVVLAIALLLGAMFQ